MTALVASPARGFGPAMPPASGAAPRWANGLLGAALLGGLLWAAADFFGDESRFPVARVDVTGDLQYADREEIERLIARFSGDGFYRLDLDAMRAALAALPWIDAAGIRRQWPERIVVEVSERRPVARWGEAALLAADSGVFRPHQLSVAAVQAEADRAAAWREHFARLPLLRGGDGRHAVLLGWLHNFQSRLAPVGARILALAEDQRRSVELRLTAPPGALADAPDTLSATAPAALSVEGAANGAAAGDARRGEVLVRLGRERLEARVARLVSIYADYVAGDPTVRSVDLRYANGFALGRGTARAAARGEIAAAEGAADIGAAPANSPAGAE